MGSYAIWKALREGRDVELTLEMRQGMHLEAFALELVGEHLGMEIEAGEAYTFLDEEHPFLCAHVDGLADNRKILIETKCPMPQSIDKWPEDLSDWKGCPRNYIAQAQWYAGLLGCERIILAAYFAGRYELRPYEVPVIPEVYKQMREKCIKFYKEYVETGKEPPIERDSRRVNEELKDKHPTSNGKIKKATPEETQMIEWGIKIRDEYKELEDKYSVLKSQAKDWEAGIKDLIGDHDGIETETRKITWKPNKNGTRCLRIGKESK